MAPEKEIEHNSRNETMEIKRVESQKIMEATKQAETKENKTKKGRKKEREKKRERKKERRKKRKKERKQSITFEKK